eukprot:scaffold37786_cov37-Attheya_sp.AAC.1
MEKSAGTAAAAAPMLVPSQAQRRGNRRNHRRSNNSNNAKSPHDHDMSGESNRSAANDSNDAADEASNKKTPQRPRRRRQRSTLPVTVPPAQALHADANEFVPGAPATGRTLEGTENGTVAAAAAGPKKKPNRRNRRKKNAPKDSRTTGSAADDEVSEKKTNRPSRRRVKASGKFAWRELVPEGTVDPISLDPLDELAYPPFCLVAEAPYVPISEWPIPSTTDSTGTTTTTMVDNNDDIAKRELERQQRILQEQWGSTTQTKKDLTSPPPKLSDENKEKKERYLHLFDGRSLAYYLVSQLQFIDPLNRRDLTRDELLALDAYLKRHGFVKAAKVVEAYDAHGVTVSRAGVAGQTPAGRAQLLQQEAQALLGSLYQTTTTQPRRIPPTPRDTDYGIYVADEGGMVMIDDDENPGLRGGLVPQVSDNAPVGPSSSGPNTLWSASHIREQYHHGARAHADNFPALSATTTTKSSQTTPPATTIAPTKPSKSLLKISNVVKKTDPAEVARQREAREEAQRRAMLSKLSFVTPGTNPSVTADVVMGGFKLDGHAVTGTTMMIPSEAHLERNRAFASALGVAPVTARQNTNNFNSGWARPVMPTATSINHDEFGKELQMVQYPESLLTEARERMGDLLKLERRWKSFLVDDATASIPLRSMERPLRKFVHEYSDFWNLHTESFDPEPK